MNKIKQRELAITKAISILTMDNPIGIFEIAKLKASLDAMELADIGVLIASEYSPEGNARWQDVVSG